MYDLSTLSASLPLHDLVLLAFYGLTGIYLIFTAIVYFHWNAYSVSVAVGKLTAIVYLVITLPLLAVMGLATFVI